MTKKLLSLVLALMLLCGTASAAVTAKGIYPIVDEPLTLKIAMPISAKVEDINTNQLTLWLEEKTGIQLEFVELAVNDQDTQVNMLMTSGDLPDMFWGYGFSHEMLCNYAEAGLIVPLDDFISQYGDYIHQFCTEIGGNPLAYCTCDGQIYAVPSGGGMITDTYGAFAFRIQNQFLEALDMELPHTLDTFYEFLVGVRDNDVNGNGDPSDEIPLTSCVGIGYVDTILRSIGNAYQYTATDSFLKVTPEGKVEFVADNDKFKATVEYIRKLVDEKLLDPASFTQDSSVLASQVAAEGSQVGAMAVGYFLTSIYDTSTEEYLNVRMLPNLEGPDGYKATMYQVPSINTAMVVTSACKNPDAAYRLCDFLLSDEAGVAFRLGFEGAQWKKSAEGEKGRDGNQAWYTLLTEQEWIQPSTNVIWDTGSITHATVMNHAEASATASLYAVSDDIKNLHLVDEVTHEWLPQLIMDPDVSSDYLELQKMIVDYVMESYSKFVLGYRNMSEWDGYVAELHNMGVDHYVAMAQDAYDAMFAQ